MATTQFEQALTDAQGRLPNRAQGDGGSALVAGANVLAGVGVAVADAARTQIAENKTNEILGVLTQGDGVDETSGGISQSEVSDVRKAQLAVEQGKAGAVSRRTATLIKRVKKLKADGRTELEIANAFRIAGISDPRLAGLQEASDAAERQKVLDDDLRLRFVQGAGIAYQLDEDGNPAGATGKPIDIDVSFAKAQKDKIEFDDLTKQASMNYQANVSNVMDGLRGMVNGQLAPAMLEINELSQSGRIDGENVARVQEDIRDIVANMEIRKGEFLSTIPDKANRDDAEARFDAIIAPYKEFLIGDADPAMFQDLARKNRLVAQADKLNFGRANDVFREILNSNPELAKVMASSIAFRTLELSQDPVLSKTYATYLNGLMGVVEFAEKGIEPVEIQSPEMAKVGSRDLVSVFASLDPAALTENTAEIIHNGVGTGISKFEIDVKAALNPVATSDYTIEDKQEVFRKVLSNPKMKLSIDELAKRDPAKAEEIGSMVNEAIAEQFQETTLNMRNSPGFLQEWAIVVDPKTQKFTTQIDKNAPASGFTGRTFTQGFAERPIKIMNNYVDALMRYREYDHSVDHLNDAEARHFYQESALLLDQSRVPTITPPRATGNLGGAPTGEPPRGPQALSGVSIERNHSKDLAPLMQNADDAQLQTLANESNDPLILQAAQDEIARRGGE